MSLLNYFQFSVPLYHLDLEYAAVSGFGRELDASVRYEKITELKQRSWHQSWMLKVPGLTDLIDCCLLRALAGIAPIIVSPYRHKLHYQSRLRGRVDAVYTAHNR